MSASPRRAGVERGAHGIQRPLHVDVDHLRGSRAQVRRKRTIRTDARVRGPGCRAGRRRSRSLTRCRRPGRHRERRRAVRPHPGCRGRRRPGRKSQLDTLPREPSGDRALMPRLAPVTRATLPSSVVIRPPMVEGPDRAVGSDGNRARRRQPTEVRVDGGSSRRTQVATASWTSRKTPAATPAE